jgi:hypothetical protein
MTRSARASSTGFSEIKRRGGEAAIHATMRAGELLDAGNMERRAVPAFSSPNNASRANGP